MTNFNFRWTMCFFWSPQLSAITSIPHCLSPTAAVHWGRHLAGCSRLLFNMTFPAPIRPHPQEQFWLCNRMLALSSTHSDSHSPPFISLPFIISLSFPPSPECMIAVYHLSHRVDFPETHHTTPVQQYTPESSVTVILLPSGPVSIIPDP